LCRTKTFERIKDQNPVSARNVIFIVGIGRSGTSLLQNMLNAHSEICFLPENSFLRRYHASGAYAKRLSQDGAGALARDLANDENFARLGLSPDRIRSIIEAPESASGDGFFRRVLSEVEATCEACKLVGDKDPKLIEFLPLLAASFPEAHIIHIHRDPRDVILSKTRAEWSKDRPFLANLFAGRVQWSIVKRTGNHLFSGRFHELAYEDLIANPQDTLMGICDVLGLSFEPAMLSPAKGGRALVASDEMSWKKESLGPLMRNNTEKWRQGLLPVQIALTEAVCGTMMRQAGYAKAEDNGPVSLFQRLGIVFQAALTSLLDAPYCWYRKWTQPK